MSETFLDGRVTLHSGDCLDILKTLDDDSVDACVTDPPYHLTSIVKRFGGENAKPTKAKGATGVFKRSAGGFMGKQWDGGDIAFQPDVWREVLRVLKPGGYVLAFASTRGFGRMSVAIEDAGFVGHPLIEYLFDAAPAVSGFFASLNAEQSEAFVRLVDAADGGTLSWIFGQGFPKASRIKADGFDGWRYGGQSLKPAVEPIFMGQKPFSEKNGTANILKHGTGAVNIDGCRIGTDETISSTRNVALGSSGSGVYGGADKPGTYEQNQNGRWPANVVHDGSAAVLAAFPDASGMQAAVKPDTGTGKKTGNILGRFAANGNHEPRGDSGSAARFFYSSKADADDRIGSKHPTVKPVDLMRWLVRLVTPPGGVVLDPFGGTGTTAEAAFYEGFSAVLCEREADYQADIRRRMALCLAGPDERKRESIKARQGDAPADAGPLFSKEPERELP